MQPELIILKVAYIIMISIVCFGNQPHGVLAIDDAVNGSDNEDSDY